MDESVLIVDTFWSTVFSETEDFASVAPSNSDRFLFILFTNPSARVGYDTRSVFKRILTGLNSEFSFS